MKCRRLARNRAPMAALVGAFGAHGFASADKPRQCRCAKRFEGTLFASRVLRCSRFPHRYIGRIRCMHPDSSGAGQERSIQSSISSPSRQFSSAVREHRYHSRTGMSEGHCPNSVRAHTQRSTAGGANHPTRRTKWASRWAGHARLYSINFSIKSTCVMSIRRQPGQEARRSTSDGKE